MYEDRNEDGSLSYQYFIYPENVEDEDNNPVGEFSHVEITYANGVQVERKQTRHSSSGVTDWKTRTVMYDADGKTVISDVQKNSEDLLTFVENTYPEGSAIRYEKVEYYGDKAETEKHRIQENADGSTCDEYRNEKGYLTSAENTYPEGSEIRYEKVEYYGDAEETE